MAEKLLNQVSFQAEMGNGGLRRVANYHMSDFDLEVSGLRYLI